MRRYWVDPENLKGDTLELGGESLHHIRDVCRVDVGDRFEVITGDGSAYLVEMKSLKGARALAKVLEKRLLSPLKQPFIHLYLSMPRFNTFESILQKSVELGVYQVTPVFSQLSFVRDEKKISSNRWNRWNKIIQGATRQCGRGSMMKLSGPVNLEKTIDSIDRQSKVRGLFAYEGPCELGLSNALNELKVCDFEEMHLFVGSEGGFSVQEVEAFRRGGMQPIGLGPQILRVETACLALISIIKYELNLF